MAAHVSTFDSESQGHTTNTTLVSARQRFWLRFRGKTRRKVGWWESAKAIFFLSWLNVLLIFIPIAWVSNFEQWSNATIFALCFLAIVPLEQLYHFGGEQLAMYCGKDIGDLIVITLNNAVEVTLAIILLCKCELKLLQSTITGVVLLHVLLIPGTEFFTGGARISQQRLDPQRSHMNHTLLTVGVLALTIPASFFATIDFNNNDGSKIESGPTDTLRDFFLRISRGFSVILIVIYVGARFYLHDPPGDKNVTAHHPDVPEEVLRVEKELEEAEPEVNPWVCLILLVTTVGLMAITAEFLVDSIDFARDNILEEWFGIVLLPIVSFSARAMISITYFVRQSLNGFFRPLPPPESLASVSEIDMSIQFLLFWAPFVTLLGWWINKPMSLLFDFFEVTILLGACFLVNYVTADAKTNWSGGSILIAFYAMICLAAWYYTGQNQVRIMNACEDITSAITNGVGEGD